MTIGSAWGALKKSWAQLKLALRNGYDYERIEALKARIYHIREAMGLENEELF
jgi:hypothetical protein